jgi:hemin uptake protein HemP
MGRAPEIGASIMNHTAPANPSMPATGADSGLPPRIVTSQDLLAGGRELVIQHEQAVYHLRLTGSNKLILTK